MLKPIVCAVFLSTVAIGAAVAQDAQPDRKARAEEFNKRFTEADTNADGKLTRDEAKDKMPQIYSHFDELDTDKKGYLTKQDIAKSMRKMRGAKTPASTS